MILPSDGGRRQNEISAAAGLTMDEGKPEGVATVETGAGGAAPANLPAVVAPPETPRRRRHRRLALGLAAVLMAALASAGYYAWRQAHPPLPPGVAWGNGRLEADAIDIDTKFAGRIAKLFVDEGDMVSAGQVVAIMDTQDLQAALGKAQSLARQSQRVLDEARANLALQQSQTQLARQQLDRVSALVPKGFATVELLDQRRQQMNAAIAAENAASQRVAEAEHLLEAAQHDVELHRVNILDNALKAPKDGRIQYRIANVGEVLPAGGKAFTMLDTGYVYMDIYLPTREAGRLRLGDEARIVLDAYPGHVIPAHIVFIASQAQFTPKAVETREERDKLMFRVRVRIDPERLRGRAELVRSGLPGIAYVRTETNLAWPASLQPSPPP
jgi:HlyD family secretion protein